MPAAEKILEASESKEPVRIGDVVLADVAWGGSGRNVCLAKSWLSSSVTMDVTENIKDWSLVVRLVQVFQSFLILQLIGLSVLLCYLEFVLSHLRLIGWCLKEILY